jgi:hypothetical protein
MLSMAVTEELNGMSYAMYPYYVDRENSGMGNNRVNIDKLLKAHGAESGGEVMVARRRML